jgi:hypothetical protein
MEVVQAARSMETLALVCETIWHHISQFTAVHQKFSRHSRNYLKFSDWVEESL